MIPFGDIKREVTELESELNDAIEEVLSSGWFVLGRKLEEFEAAFSAYLGGVHAVGVGSGTEAIHLALMASGVENGDYVITVPNTAVPTISAISVAGAQPLLVDIDERSFTMDPSMLREFVSKEKPKLGDKLKAIVPVHLYGQSADMDLILEVAKEFDLTVIEDACQAHGAEYKGKKVGTLGRFAAFSFYPSKNLGCYGDGGMVVAQNPEDAENLKMLRNYGQKRRYYHDIKGVNSRLDEMQAAILLVKLKYLDDWNRRRSEISQLYDRMITNPAVTKPVVMDYGVHVHHLYAIRHPDRDALIEHLAKNGVGSLIHYPVPIHMQAAYKDLGVPQGTYPVAEAAASEILSLPMFPQLTNEEIEIVCTHINSFQG